MKNIASLGSIRWRHASLSRVVLCLALLAVCAALSIPDVAVASAGGACNNFDSLATAAMATRSSGDLNKAKALADEILQRDPSDFRANYTEALISFDRSKIMHRSTGYDKAEVANGLRWLDRAIAILERMSGPCLQTAKALGWGSIYNTKGVYVFAKGDKTGAERIWLDAYNSKRDLMLPSTQILLLNNLGLLYGDDNLKRPDLSARYHLEALQIDAKLIPKSLTAPTRLQVLIPKFQAQRMAH